MRKERMLAPPISTVGTMISTMPAIKRDCGLILLLSLSFICPYSCGLVLQVRSLFTRSTPTWLAVEFVPAQSAFLRSSFLVHHLPGLAFLPIAAPRPTPAEAEDAKGVCSQADAPAQERPVKPPYPARKPARKRVDYKQTEVDHHEDAGVDVEAFDGLHPRMCPFVALLLVLYS